jgi:N-acylneuraminate cytidylyltransferase
MGKDFDYVCCILPTAPFINKKMLIAARNMLCTGEYDCVFPIVEYAYPIQRAVIIKDNFVKMARPENIGKRSQDLEKYYHDAGQFYFIKTGILLTERKLFCKRSGALILNNMEAQDIDSEADWKMAEIKYGSIRRGKIL